MVLKDSQQEGNAEKLEMLLAKAEDWRRKHGAQFERSKYVLVHFTRHRNIKTDAAITIDGTTIAPAKEAKYLGVIFDKGLRYHEHTIQKGTQFGLAIGRIAKATWGSPFQYLRRLFTSVTAPRMDYAAAIWHRPDNNSGPMTQQLRNSTVQRHIMKAITGCFRTTPTAALENETSLPSPRLRLREKILKSVTRMQTVPPSHPLHKWIQEARRNRFQVPSNLENIAKRFPEYIRELETIHPYIRPPWWSLRANIHIDASKESAEKHHRQTTVHLTNPSALGPNPSSEIAHIYTDGSGINQGIGAAMYCHTTRRTTHRHLGNERESLVYAGELEGIHMAIIHAAMETTGCRIFTDSQPAIKSIAKPKRQSGQSIIKRILDEIDELHRTNPTHMLHLEWVPGHVGIEGNEKVDQAAKQAATQINALDRGPWQTTLKSAKANAIHQSIKRECQNEWASGRKTATQLRQVTKMTNVKPSARIYEKLGNKRRDIACIARLRTH